jgi:hypothetical protein
MALSDIALLVQRIATRKNTNLEPIEVTSTISLNNYRVGQASSVTGVAVLGLQEISAAHSRSYVLHRVAGEASTVYDGDQTVTFLRQTFVVRWSDPSGNETPVAVAYDVKREIVGPTVDEDSLTIQWKFLVKKYQNAYTLVHVVAAGPGPVDPCHALANLGISCSNPRDDFERAVCKANKC